MIEFGKVSIDLLEKIIPIVCINFVETKEGLVFIKKEQNIKESQSRNSVIERNALPNIDKTALESLENHIHINEILGKKVGRILFRVAIIIGEAWANRLKSEFPGKHFRVYLAKSDDITLRFHQVHEGEPNWLNDNNWKSDISKGRLVLWDV